MSRNKPSDKAPREGSSFPEFSDGDVRVVITGSRQYKLHSGVLMNASPILRDLLEDQGPAKLHKNARNQGLNTLYRLVLIQNPDDDGDKQLSHILQAAPLDDKGNPTKDAPRGVGLELENGRILPAIYLAYDAVLAAMYNQPINLGDAQEDGLSGILSNAFQIGSIAEHLDCVRMITKPIEATLLATGQNLYRGIAHSPVPWLNFSAKVKSRAIFREALIHGAGQWGQPETRREIEGANCPPEEVLDILKRKGEWVRNTVSQASRYLASYYPAMLLREVRPGEKDNISRASYGNDIMMWMSLTVFRHFISDCMASDRTHKAPDMGWAFIDAITHGGEAYLSRKTLQENFHPRFPMTGKGMACIEHRLAEIKDDVKQWAIPLKINHTSLDLSQTKIEHFVHANVHNQDYPWVVDELAAAKELAKRDNEPFEDASEDDIDDEESDSEGESTEDVEGDPKENIDDFDGGESPIYDIDGGGAYENDMEEDDDEENRMLEKYRQECAEKEQRKTRGKRQRKS